MHPFVLMSGLVLMVACAERSEAEIQAEFDDFVRARNQCENSSECTLITLECPLGCGVAANVVHADAIRRKADELIEEYESGDRACAYGCIMLPEPECRMGRCFPGP